MEPKVTWRIDRAIPIQEIAMKVLVICIAALSFAFSTSADAKGCIKGAIVGGIAGHFAGHGKLGAVAGCVIGHHEANKADADRANQRGSQDPDHKI
jgi:uncharacterized protein YcfJ